MSEQAEKKSLSIPKTLELGLAAGALGFVFSAASVLVAPALPPAVKKPIGHILGVDIDERHQEVMNEVAPLATKFFQLQQDMNQGREQFEKLIRERQQKAAENTVQIGDHLFTYPSPDSV